MLLVVDSMLLVVARVGTGQVIVVELEAASPMLFANILTKTETAFD